MSDLPERHLRRQSHTQSHTPRPNPRRPRPLLAALLFGLLPLAPLAPAWADGDRQGRHTPLTPQYQQECGACHTAYAPGLLPAASWQGIMKGLDHHYSSDASMDPASTRQIAEWLQAHAGTSRRASQERPPEDRITRAAWFQREHRHIPLAAWSHRSVGSAANCAACHTDAEQGRFSEHSLRVPPGLERLVGRAWEDD
jgi:mono/diheme cytochrome c family protein